MSIRNALDGHEVSELMVHDPLVAYPDETLDAFMREVPLSERAAGYPVVEDGLPIGLLPLGRLEESPTDEWESLLVRERMVPLSAVLTFTPHDPAVDAILALGPGGKEVALVLDGRTLAGVIYLSDVADALRPGAGKRRPHRPVALSTQPIANRARRSDGPERDAA